MSQENIANPIPDLALVSPPEIAPESTPHLDNSVIHLDDYRQAGLPAMAYTSAKFLKQERETLFAHYWVCVGLASDVPNPGDVYPTDLAGMPSFWSGIAREHYGPFITSAATGGWNW